MPITPIRPHHKRDHFGLLIWGIAALVSLWFALSSYQAYAHAGNWIDGLFFWAGIVLGTVCAFLAGLSVAIRIRQ